MKKVCMSFEMPDSSYVGGVANILNSYMRSKSFFEQNGYDLLSFNYKNKFVKKCPFKLLRTILFLLAQRSALRKFVKKENIDIVNIHTSRRFLFLKDVFLGSYISKKNNAKVILTIHVGDINTVFNKIPRFLKTKAIKLLNKRFDTVIFLSKNIENQFHQAGFNAEKSKVLYNFFDIENADPFNKPTKNDEIIKLLFVASINREKGIFELLQALKELNDPSITLDICGMVTEDAIKEEFYKYITDLSPQVKFHGYVCGKEKAEIYMQADALVLPSYREGFPIVVLEALASNCAIISTPVGAIPEVLSEENVLWVKSKDVLSLKSAILELKNNNVLLNTLKKNNLSLCKEYENPQHINKLCKIYDDLFSHRRPKILLTLRKDRKIGGPYTSSNSIIRSKLCNKYDLEAFYIPNPRQLRKPREFFKVLEELRRKKPDIVQITGLQMQGFLMQLVCTISKVKSIIAVRGSSLEATGFNMFSRFIFRIIENYTLRHADAAFGVSNYVSSWNICKKTKRYYGTIYNIVDFSEQAPLKKPLRKELGISTSDVVITSTGRITTDKGFDVLLAVTKRFKDFENVKFVIAGDGEYKTTLVDKIKSANLQNKVFVLGYREDIDNILCESDIFVICTKHETLCNSLLEAGKRSLPLVASDVGGIPEIIDNGKNGFLVPVGDVNGFENALKKLVDNENLRKTFGSEAKKKIEFAFNEDKIIAKLDELFKFVLGDKNDTKRP